MYTLTEVTSERTDSPVLSGRVTALELLELLVDLPADAEYRLSMRESKHFPTEIKGYQCLSVEGFGMVWKSDRISRDSTLGINELQRSKRRSVSRSEVGTVRSLTHSLIQSGLEEIGCLDIVGHFDSGLTIVSYPKAAPEPTPAPSELEETSSWKPEGPAMDPSLRHWQSRSGDYYTEKFAASTAALQRAQQKKDRTRRSFFDWLLGRSAS